MWQVKNKLLIALFLILTVSSTQVQAKMSKDAFALYQQACALEYQHKYPEAVKLLIKAIEMSGDDAVIYTKLAGLYADLSD